MLGYNQQSTSAQKAFFALLLGTCVISTGTASAQTRPTVSKPVQVAPVAPAAPGQGAISLISLDATYSNSFEHETCDKGKVVQCNKATIFVFSTPLINSPNNGASTGVATKPAVGSTLTYLVTMTNNGPSLAKDVRLVDVRRTGVNCPDSGAIAVSTGVALPSSNYTIADLTGPGIPFAKLDLGQSTTLTYSCQVN
jgi:uncharacterized repeat protein (TIGR01451 family)